jgi:putative ABC transport system permease protein
MWLISARDLQFRLRRFLIAVAVTALVFGIALMFDGVKHAMQNEGGRVVDSFQADEWVVAAGATGPFTTTKVIPVAAADGLREQPGVQRADPVVVSRTVLDVADKDANLIGYVPGGLGEPAVTEGRALERPGEVVVGAAVDASVGDRLSIGGSKFRVVGTTDAGQFNFGTPTVYVSVADAQKMQFGEQPLAMAIAVKGEVPDVPAGLAIRTNEQGVADMQRPIKSGVETIDFTSIMLWLIAAGIIGSIIYLTALERVRDFAVFKATGAPTRVIVGGLLIQAITLALVAAIVAVGLAKLLSIGLPFPAEIGASSLLQLGVIAIVVGALASLAGVRRALKTDPAAAFGGA